LADEAEAGTTVEPDPREAPSRSDMPTGGGPGLGAIAGIVAAAGLFVSGAVLFMGWKYTQAFYGRLGIPTEALDLEPADYFTAKIEFLYWLAMSAAASLVGWFLVLRLVRDRQLHRVMLVMLLGALVFMAGSAGTLVTGDGHFVFIAGLGVGLFVIGISDIFRGPADRNAVVAGTFATLFLSFAVVTLLFDVSAGLGQHDADALLAGPQEGSGARLVAAEALGLPGERYESDAYVTESVGVIRATGDAYFVVVRGTDKVYSFPAARVLRMEYTPDKGR